MKIKFGKVLKIKSKKEIAGILTVLLAVVGLVLAIPDFILGIDELCEKRYIHGIFNCNKSNEHPHAGGASNPDSGINVPMSNTIKIDDKFEIDTSKVTVDQYISFRGDFTSKSYGNSPVDYVSWNEANEYCESHGKRLPTLKELERVRKAVANRDSEWIVDCAKEGCEYRLIVGTGKLKMDEVDHAAEKLGFRCVREI